MKDKLRRRVIYFGRVQNVGFRWNVSNILSKFSLTGYVKNLDDGSVEVLLEGEDIEVKVVQLRLIVRCKVTGKEKSWRITAGNGISAVFQLLNRGGECRHLWRLRTAIEVPYCLW